MIQKVRCINYFEFLKRQERLERVAELFKDSSLKGSEVLRMLKKM